MPDELLDRGYTSRQFSELMAHYHLEYKEWEKERKKSEGGAGSK